MTGPAAFARATAVTPLGEGRYSATIPDGWQQGRGAFGGVVLAAMLRAVEAADADVERRTRTLMGDLCGPVLPGEVTLATRLLRRGKSQSNWQVELAQGGATLAVASVVRSLARAVTAPVLAAARPPRVPYGDVPVLAIAPPVGPTFAQHYELRPHGAMPFGGGPEPVVTGWVREREPLAAVDAPAIIARLDAYYPALFSVDRGPRPIATVAFAAEVLVDPASLDPAAPLHFAARDVALTDGFFVELRELWHGDRLAALNQQTFAILT